MEVGWRYLTACRYVAMYPGFGVQVGISLRRFLADTDAPKSLTLGPFCPNKHPNWSNLSVFVGKLYTDGPQICLFLVVEMVIISESSGLIPLQSL